MGQQIADNNNNSLLPNLGESQLLVNNVPSGSNLAMHLPHQQEDQVQSHLQPLVYEDTHDVWDNGVMPFLGIVQLHDDSLVMYLILHLFFSYFANLYLPIMSIFKMMCILDTHVQCTFN